MSRIISCSHPLFPAGGKRRRCNAPTPRPPVSVDTEAGKGVSSRTQTRHTAAVCGYMRIQLLRGFTAECCSRHHRLITTNTSLNVRCTVNVWNWTEKSTER